MNGKALSAQVEGFGGAARLVLLDRHGREIERSRHPRRRQATPKEWDEGLTAMRESTTARLSARLALGGRVEGYKGKMPGVAEEVALALKAGLPVYLLGGFGGCVRDIAVSMGLVSSSPVRPDEAARRWSGSDAFRSLTVADLRNGLTFGENARLAETPHVDEAVTLVLRGLRRSFDPDDQPRPMAAGMG